MISTLHLTLCLLPQLALRVLAAVCASCKLPWSQCVTLTAAELG